MEDEYTEQRHFRLSKDQLRVVKKACKVSGAKMAPKARELLVAWAQEKVAEANILTGKGKA